MADVERLGGGLEGGRWLVRLAPDRCGGVSPRAFHRSGRDARTTNWSEIRQLLSQGVFTNHKTLPNTSHSALVARS